MRPVAPRIDGFCEIMSGDDSDTTNAIVVAQGCNSRGEQMYVTRWRPNALERDAILLGHDVYVVQFGTFDPIRVFAGAPENVISKESDHE